MADLTTASTDEHYLLLSLQGIVNRTRPRIYMSSAAFGPFWLAQSGIPATTVADPMTLVAKYAAEVKGIVIYDDTLMDTVNLATTIAGVEGGVVSSPALAPTLQAQGFPVLADLRTNHFASALAVYQWELANVAPRCSSQIVVGLKPTIADCLRDYAVATQAAVFWLDPTDAAQLPVLDGFLQRMQTNAPYMGWWTQEQKGVGEAARFGVPTYAADFAQNLSALAGVRCSIQPPAAPPPPSLGNKVYVALFVSDGDNVCEDQNLIIQRWADPARGQVPISWTVQSGLVDLDPTVLSYYWRTATPNDVLVSGPSGLGYTYPGSLPSVDAYTKVSADYLAQAGLRVVTVWSNSPLPLFLSSWATSFATNMPHLLGVTDQVSFAGDSVIGGTLPSIAFVTAYGNTESELETGIDTQLLLWGGKSPLFLAVQGNDNQPAMTPSLLLAVEKHYAGNPNVVFVRADHLFQLFREANGLPINP